jgi:hypothetical protein
MKYEDLKEGMMVRIIGKTALTHLVNFEQFKAQVTKRTGVVSTILKDRDRKKDGLYALDAMVAISPDGLYSFFAEDLEPIDENEAFFLEGEQHESK